MGNCLSGGLTDSRRDQILPTQDKQPIKQKWQTLLKTDSIRYQPADYMAEKLTHVSFEQIKKDIDRTYPAEPEFSIPQKKTIFKEALEEVTLYFPKLGYIQGINFIVGFFILCDMNKLEAIRTFISIVTHKKLMLYGIYEGDFSLIRLYCEVFWSILEEKAPVLAKKIKDLNVPDELWIFQWFLCFYIYSFPRSYIKQLLTFIWEHKEFAVIKIAVAIMLMLQPKFSQTNRTKLEDEFIECMEMLKSQSYVKEHLPLKKLLIKAEKIDNQFMMRHLEQVKSDSWFKKYFIANEKDRVEMYRKFKEDIEEERKEFIVFSKKGMGASKSSKIGKSTTMIDHIEEIRAARFNVTLVNSLSEKVPNSSFVKHQQRFSMVREPIGNKPLVQSVYMN